MLGARVGEAARRGLGLEVQQGVDVGRFQSLAAPGVELRRPGRHARSGVPQRGQVVGEEAAADDQHALVAQGRQLAADVHQAARVQRRHGDLQDRYVGFRVHLHERDVRAVVEAAVRDVLDRGAGGLQECPYRGGQRGGAGGTVADAVVVLGKAPEVVHQRYGLGGAEGERGLLPVRGDHQDRAGSGQAGGPGGQLAGPDRVVGEGRRPVAEVERRHAGGLRGGGRGRGGGRARAGDLGHGSLLVRVQRGRT